MDFHGAKRSIARSIPLFDRGGVGRYPRENFSPNLTNEDLQMSFPVAFFGTLADASRHG
jgi:hypothetical protein